MAAPALAASIAEEAICSGVTGTAGFLPGESADPVTAQEIITLRCTAALPKIAFLSSLQRSAGRRNGVGATIRILRTLHPIVRCAKPRRTRFWNESELKSGAISGAEGGVFRAGRGGR